VSDAGTLLQDGGSGSGSGAVESRGRRSSSAEPQSHARAKMVLRSPSALRRRESAAAVPYTGRSSAGTWSPAHHAVVPEVKLVPDPGGGGGATCVRAAELTDEELEAMLYRLHRVRRRRASEAAAAATSVNAASSSLQFDTTPVVRSSERIVALDYCAAADMDQKATAPAADADAACSIRSIWPARGTHSSKPAACCCSGQ